MVFFFAFNPKQTENGERYILSTVSFHQSSVRFQLRTAIYVSLNINIAANEHKANAVFEVHTD
jgi:hypothetical protein